MEDAALDLLEKVWDVFVIERQASAEECVQNDTAAPHVDLHADARTRCIHWVDWASATKSAAAQNKGHSEKSTSGPA